MTGMVALWREGGGGRCHGLLPPLYLGDGRCWLALTTIHHNSPLTFPSLYTLHHPPHSPTLLCTPTIILPKHLQHYTITVLPTTPHRSKHPLSRFSTPHRPTPPINAQYLYTTPVNNSKSPYLFVCSIHLTMPYVTSHSSHLILCPISPSLKSRPWEISLFTISFGFHLS